jgi:hypothetical protein
VLLILSFLVYLPRSKHLHILTAAVNVFFGRTRARGRLVDVAVRAGSTVTDPVLMRVRRAPRGAR